MSIKTISKILITLSIVMIFISMNMDTSVSTSYGRVNNIGLLNDQSNLILLGAIGFLAGIILYSSNTARPTKQEEDEKAASYEQLREVGFVVEDAAQGLISNFNKWFSNLDYLLIRIVIFIYIAYSFDHLRLIILNYLDYGKAEAATDAESMVLLVVGIWLLLPRPLVIISKNLLFSHSFIWATLAIVSIAQYLNNQEKYLLNIFYLSLVYIVVSLGLYLIFRKYLKSKTAHQIK